MKKIIQLALISFLVLISGSCFAIDSSEVSPTKIEHLYVISPYSREIIIYSTIKGEITYSGSDEFKDSGRFMSWHDEKGRKHKHLISDSQIIHITDYLILRTDSSLKKTLDIAFDLTKGCK